MNFLSKMVLVLLASLLAASGALLFKMEKSSKEQRALHAEIIGKLDGIHSIHAKPAEEAVPDVSGQKLFGLDISHWDGDIVQDIPKIDRISFLICKATQGDGDIDPDFERNWSLIKEQGALRGAYHFYIYADDPLAQAVHFCTTVGPLSENDISLVLDVEELSLPRSGVDKEKLQNDVTIFLEEVERRIKRKPIIYADYAFANEYLDNIKYADYPLWLAEYSKSATPRVPDTWKDRGYMIWQKSDKYNVNSIETDFDVSDGSRSDLLLP